MLALYGGVICIEISSASILVELDASSIERTFHKLPMMKPLVRRSTVVLMTAYIIY